LIGHARKLYASQPIGLDLDAPVYALYSTTIDLCLSLFAWAPFRSAKGAIKLHTLLDLRGAIPAFVHVSGGKMHDVNVLNMLTLEAGSFYVMDRAYVALARLHTIHRTGGFFVTRGPVNTAARHIYSHPLDRSSGVVCNQSVRLDGFRSGKKYPDLLRRIRFPPRSGKTLVFLTNNTALPPAAIAALYKSRWQVELFFK
jgi:hypothetical protein